MLANISVTHWQCLGRKSLAVVLSKLLNRSFVMFLALWKRRTHKVKLESPHSKSVGLETVGQYPLLLLSTLALLLQMMPIYMGNITYSCPVSADV